MFRTCLWFDNEAAVAADFYVSVFPNSRILETEYYPEGSFLPAGSVLTVTFELDGQPFLALNGGKAMPHTEAVSLQIPCANQAEIDHYWQALTADGEESSCGWLRDRFGFSWQVVPTDPIFRSEDGPEANARVNEALMAMRKLDLAALEAARRG